MGEYERPQPLPQEELMGLFREYNALLDSADKKGQLITDADKNRERQIKSILSIQKELDKARYDFLYDKAMKETVTPGSAEAYKEGTESIRKSGLSDE